MTAEGALTEGPLAGVRAIVIEDDFTVARGLAWMLEGLACEVVGMAGKVAAALSLVESTRFDVAVLDLRLDQESITPVAALLVERGVPIVYLSGYADLDVLPEELRGFPRLDKPADPERLVDAIREVLGMDKTN